ncbi:MAG TPA: hypothetical protein VFJ12_06610 [Segeticoccus sp.]|nr:hypothetical protein [Segeticoccus sp.]
MVTWRRVVAAAVIVLVIGVGWVVLGGRDTPMRPDLGPAVQVRLTTPAGDRSPTTRSRPDATAPSPTHRTGHRSPTSSTAPGARTVPRHVPAPAGDEDDDADDHEDDRDDGPDGDSD